MSDDSQRARWRVLAEKMKMAEGVAGWLHRSARRGLKECRWRGRPRHTVALCMSSYLVEMELLIRKNTCELVMTVDRVASGST